MEYRRQTTRRASPLTPLLAVGLLCPGAAAAQQIEEGRPPRNIEVVVEHEPYELGGETGEEILLELRALAPTAGWVWFPLFYTWRFDMERVQLAGGLPSANCVPVNFRMVLTFSAVYPEWRRPPDASDELVAAWEAFADLVTRSWETRRDDAVARARILLREVPRMEEMCAGLGDRIEALVEDTYEAELPDRLAADPAPGLRWPPVGHEAVLRSAPPAASAAAATPPPAPSPNTDPLPGVPPGSGGGGSPGASPVPFVQPALDVVDAVEADLRSGLAGVAPSRGFVMGVMHEGALQFLEAFGTSSATSEPMDVEHEFAFPALTEVLVSTLAAALGGAGVVDLDEPIARALPGLSPRLGSVTLRQLISHRAGIDNAPPRDTTLAWSVVLDRLDDAAMMTDPGTVYSHSRYSYGLAVRALEARLGLDLEEAIRQTLLEPLGLEDTRLGRRDAEDALYELPVTYTTVPNLMVFWLSAIAGDIPGAAPDAIAAAPRDGPPGAGRSFFRGAWVDRFGDFERVTLMCRARGTTVGFQIIPRSGSIVVVGSEGGLPIRTTIFALGRIGEALGVGNAIYGPRPLDGGASPNSSPSRCEIQGVSWTNLVQGFDSPAPPGDWAGRYLNGELQFSLEVREGALVSPRGGAQDPLEIHHFEGDTYFAAATDAARPFGFPIELFRDEQGRRYARVGERAYLHDEDRGR